MFFVHIGNAVLDIVKSTLDQIQQIQHIILVISQHLRPCLYLHDKCFIIPDLSQTFLNIHLIDIKVIRCFQDMILLPYDLFHITVQMFPQNPTVRILLQELHKEFIHIMKHILQCLIQPPRIHQSRP